MDNLPKRFKEMKFGVQYGTPSSYLLHRTLR